MKEDLQDTIKANLDRVRERISQAAQRSGRSVDEISLVAVTKEKSALVVKILLENGIRAIGESYLKEALFKIGLLEDFELEWHMIGNIQSGKEKRIAESFQVVHSVSRLETAQKLNTSAKRIGKILPVYLELNVSGEDSKQGWDAAKSERWEELLPEVEEILALPSLEVKGLMTIAPYLEDPEGARPYFRKLREVRNFINSQIPGTGLSGLSMGMSGDFEVAIEEGSTVLRIGSALVGQRN